MEIRVYFESIEQAHNFIKPIILQALEQIGGSSRVKLVKLRGNYELYSKNIAPIIYWKNPDAVISCIKDGVEYPLVLIEFSSCVFTEDHELQRFDGLVAALNNNCFYAKISPSHKSSSSAHGGNTKYDYAAPYASIQNLYGKTFFHFDWKVDSRGVVENDNNLLSYPKKIEDFELFLKTLILQAAKVDFQKDWMKVTTEELKNHKSFSDWFSQLALIPTKDLTKLQTSRTKWVIKDPLLGRAALELKLNRFGHAMDPERGMLAYYRTISETIISKMQFSESNYSWFHGVSEQINIEKQIETVGLTRAYDFLICFAMGSGLNKNKDFMEVVKNFEKDKSSNLTIDLTIFLQKNFAQLNKPLRTIFKYSSIFAIEDVEGRKRIIFGWIPYNEHIIFSANKPITQIFERTSLDEDDVTYISVHNILVPNGYKILAVSYPGAQGDRKILIAQGTGRDQPREYIDIISFLPSKYTNLQENKGKYSKAAIQGDINELVQYKKNKVYQKGLTSFQEVFAPESLGTELRIGVGFWSSESFLVSKVKDLDLNEVDYFVAIQRDGKKWSIWSKGKNDMFKTTEGCVSVPKTFDVFPIVRKSNPLV
jgi:hypothetical protein